LFTKIILYMKEQTMAHKPSQTPSKAALVTPPSSQPSGRGGTAVLEREVEISPEFEAAVFGTAESTLAPTLEPPAEALQRGISGTWVTNKKVNALWSINQNRNSWASIDGIGWKKFANNSDSAIMAFSILAANAKQTQGVTNYREESNGMIYEMYVW
jgi:hypothetical protein